MRVQAPAKVNLHLRVGPLDGTGFHPLMSWMCTVGLFDTLTIERAATDVIRMTCDDPALPCDATNLVVRAAAAIQSEVRSRAEGSVAATGLQIHLEKRIPPGGGLGGGSSDAACTLLGVSRLWDLGWPVDHLARIAAALGSDVPFFLHGPSSICTGRGEFVRPIARPKPRWIVLILPSLALPTPAVYRKFDELGLGERHSIETEPSWPQWADLSAGPLLARLVNDLEPAAFAICPELGILRERLEQGLSRVVRMSGSGSSLFTLFETEIEAQAAVERIQRQSQGIRALAVPMAPDISAE